MGPKPVELLVDCGTCRVEAGAVERYDPHVGACRFGLPAEVRCRLCGRVELGVLAPEMRQLAPGTPSSECPVCAALLGPEDVDARCCRRCGALARLEIAEAGRDLAAAGELEAALDAWAGAEGWPSRDA